MYKRQIPDDGSPPKVDNIVVNFQNPKVNEFLEIKVNFDKNVTYTENNFLKIKINGRSWEIPAMLNTSTGGISETSYIIFKRVMTAKMYNLSVVEGGSVNLPIKLDKLVGPYKDQYGNYMSNNSQSNGFSESKISFNSSRQTSVRFQLQSVASAQGLNNTGIKLYAWNNTTKLARPLSQQQRDISGGKLLIKVGTFTKVVRSESFNNSHFIDLSSAWPVSTDDNNVNVRAYALPLNRAHQYLELSSNEVLFELDISSSNIVKDGPLILKNKLSGNYLDADNIQRVLEVGAFTDNIYCLLYTSPRPRD